MKRQTGGMVSMIAGALLAFVPAAAVGCPFCEAVSQTFGERIELNDVAVLAKLLSTPDSKKGAEPGGGASEKSKFAVQQVIKGEEHLEDSSQIAAYYYGENKPGSRFLALATLEKGELLWAAPVPVSEKTMEYILAGQQLPDSPPKRLAFFQEYLENEESQLALDAYDEFAQAPYDALIAMKEDMDREQLKEWIRDPEVTANHRRLYLTMLGVCGTEEDIPLLEERLAAHSGKAPSGLDALVACYLKLKGPSGLPLIEDRFLKNKEAEFSDTYAAITALRFIGEQTDTIPRERVAQSFHHMLDRPDLADLVIRDLARWEDWSVVSRMVELFRNADEQSSWVRQPVARYLMVCPLPEAKQHLKELRKVDAEAIDRAGSVLALLGGRGRAASGDEKPATSDADNKAGDSAAKGSDARSGDGDEDDSSKENEDANPEGNTDEETNVEKDADDEQDSVSPAGKKPKRAAASDTKTKPPEPPTYWAVLGIPALAGLILLGALWLVLSGVGSRSLE